MLVMKTTGGLQIDFLLQKLLAAFRPGNGQHSLAGIDDKFEEEKVTA